MFRARTLSLFTVLFLLVAGETLGAPLRLVTSQMDARISGSALSYQGGPASYTASSMSSSAWNCRLEDSVAILPPTYLGGATGSAGSATGMRIEQPAANEFVFTLSAASNGVYQPGADAGVSGGYRADSHAFLKTCVAIDPYPGHPIGTPATFQITVEHVGDMSSRNNAYTFNLADVSINGRQFGYHKSLSLPQGSWGDFTDLTVHGHRDTTVSQTFTGAIGQTIDLMAIFDSRVDTGQSSAFVGSDAAVDFEDGLRIHLTAMPEPSAAVLGLLGLGFTALRRRR